MKSTCIFFLVTLACSVAAAPSRRAVQANEAFRGGFGRGGFGGRKGGNGGKNSESIRATSTVVSAAASSSVVATAVSSAVLAQNSGGATADSKDPQNSTKLDPSVICSNYADDGQNPPVAGQSPSTTSTNNYINFCALTLPQTPLTNGLQITTGSCNPAPIGLIPSVDQMPSAKFKFPKNGGTVAANQAFTAQLALANFHSGVFTNAQKTYFAAPQTLDKSGLIIGHTHIVIEALTSIDQIEPSDPTKFAFFKGVNDPDVGGIASASVDKGVPAGTYRICSINSSSNHQPVIVPVAQHGSLDDCSYFTAK